MNPRLRQAALAAGFVVVYAAACVFADRIVGPSQVALYWPASGLAFAVVVVGGGLAVAAEGVGAAAAGEGVLAVAAQQLVPAGVADDGLRPLVALEVDAVDAVGVVGAQRLDAKVCREAEVGGGADGVVARLVVDAIVAGDDVDVVAPAADEQVGA